MESSDSCLAGMLRRARVAIFCFSESNQENVKCILIVSHSYFFSCSRLFAFVISRRPKNGQLSSFKTPLLRRISVGSIVTLSRSTSVPRTLLCLLILHIKHVEELDRRGEPWTLANFRDLLRKHIVAREDIFHISVHQRRKLEEKDSKTRSSVEETEVHGSQRMHIQQRGIKEVKCPMVKTKSPRRNVSFASPRSLVRSV